MDRRLLLVHPRPLAVLHEADLINTTGNWMNWMLEATILMMEILEGQFGDVRDVRLWGRSN